MTVVHKFTVDVECKKGLRVQWPVYRKPKLQRSEACERKIIGKEKERVNGFQNTSKDWRTLMKSGIRSFGTSVFQHCRSQKGEEGRKKTIGDQERLKFGGSSSSFIGTAPHSRTILLKSRTTFSGTRSHNSDLE